MKYQTPESPYYTRTVAEVWFTSADAAEAAGPRTFRATPVRNTRRTSK